MSTYVSSQVSAYLSSVLMPETRRLISPARKAQVFAIMDSLQS